MEMETKGMPSALPVLAKDCATLAVWRSLVLGKTQKEVAEKARVKQARISEVELGKVMPRKRYWPQLMDGYSDGVIRLSEADFYRMVMYARISWQKAKALTTPAADDAPLFSTNVYAPSGAIVVAADLERRAQA